MKRYLLLVVIIITSCAENKSANTVSSSATDSLSTQDTTTALIASFRAFRDAVYKGDKAAVKKFIDFPIMNEGNEIWYLAAGNPPSTNGEIKPFTEIDFDKHFSSIFPDEFIKTILKVKSEILFKKGSNETPLIETDTGTTHILYADVMFAEKILTLNLAMRGIYKNGDDVDPVEFNVLYEFAIINKRTIKFRQVRIAG